MSKPKKIQVTVEASGGMTLEGFQRIYAEVAHEVAQKKGRPRARTKGYTKEVLEAMRRVRDQIRADRVKQEGR